MSLVQYSEESSDSDMEPTLVPAPVSQGAIASFKNKLMTIAATPLVVERDDIKPYDFISTDCKVLPFNPTVEQLYTKEVGPVNPFKTQQALATKNMFCGYVEKSQVSDFLFDAQRKTFHTKGYAEDPTAYADKAEKSYVGAVEKAVESDCRTVFEEEAGEKKKKRKREHFGDPSDPDNYKGPWASYVDEVKSSGPTEEERAMLDSWAARKEPKANAKPDENEKTILHIEDTHDYQGRSFLVAPKDLDVNLYSEEPPEKCFLPKKLIHTWSGHNKGVSKVILFPKTAHVMLSCGMDSKIKLWEVYGKRRCIRTYAGHSKAVRDVVFNNDGSKFLSASYDRMIKLWDTETGECLARFTSKKIPYCVQFHPEPDKQHLFIAGMSDKKIVAFDTNTGEIVQEYDRHLGAVNTITFIDRNRRFVSTSDDKSIRVWEWDIPVDIKYIAEPSMHAIPSVSLSYTGKWMACQSMDNEITIFGTAKLRQNRKKIFKGHMVAGYACQTNFSPDGSYLISGDADGKVFIWDWKSTKVYSRFKAHEGVCIGAVWHPHETSKLITCGWDGEIKLWD